jgi:hypothetical protein
VPRILREWQREGLIIEFRSQENRAARTSYNAREYARLHNSHSFQPSEQFHDLNASCPCHDGRRVVLRGYEIGPGLDGGWEECKESLPTLDADHCLEYAEVRSDIDPSRRTYIAVPPENLRATPIRPCDNASKSY